MSLRSAVLAISLISFFGCSKEKSFEEGGNSNGGNPPPTGEFRAKINGVQWIAADNARGASVIGGIINISGISSDNKQISITITGSSPGKYNLDQLSASVAAFVDGNSGNNFAYTTNQGTDTSMAGGVVNITEIDAVNKTISGNFQFKVYRNMDSQQLLVTEGVFTKIPYVTSLPPASNSEPLMTPRRLINPLR